MIGTAEVGQGWMAWQKGGVTKQGRSPQLSPGLRQPVSPACGARCCAKGMGAGGGRAGCARRCLRLAQGPRARQRGKGKDVMVPSTGSSWLPRGQGWSV